MLCPCLGLRLTIRSYTDAVRHQILASIKRICLGTAQAAGLAKLVTDKFVAWLGKGALIKRQPTMGGEDFGMYGRTKYKVPTFMFALGTVPTDLIRRFHATGKPLPMVHSSTYAPDIEPTLRTGVTATTAAALELLKK